jgi:hypothetical protein
MLTFFITLKYFLALIMCMFVVFVLCVLACGNLQLNIIMIFDLGT